MVMKRRDHLLLEAVAEKDNEEEIMGKLLVVSLWNSVLYNQMTCYFIVPQSKRIADTLLDANRADEGYHSGTTAIACLVQEDQLIVANAGDSRCVLSSGGHYCACTECQSR